jgi:hypothetical protein
LTWLKESKIMRVQFLDSRFTLSSIFVKESSTMRALQMRVSCFLLPALLLVLWPTAATASYISVIEADNPIGYWRLGESGGTTAADSSGNGHTGTTGGLTGVTLGGSTGAIVGDSNNAAYFAGSSSKTSIVVANDSAFNFDIGNAFTIEAWVKPTASSSADPIVVKDKHVTAPNYAGYYLTLDPTYGPYFQLEGSSTAYLYKYASTVTLSSLCDGNWHYVAATYDGSNTLAGMALYVDGAAIATTNASAGTITSMTTTDPFYIGKKVTTVTRAFYGSMDEVAVYGSALTGTEVLTHYNTGMGIPTPEPSTMALLATGLVGLLAYAWKKRR